MKKLLVILSLFFVTSNASADILLEPYVGYNIATTTQKNSSDGDVTGLGYGARLGFTLPLVFFAFDYSVGTVDVEYPSSKPEADYTDMGVVVGASLPILRVWAGYYFSAEVEFPTYTAEGSGMKAGLGFKMPVLPISFNVEYILKEYDESAGQTLANKIESKGLFISLSAPLEF